MPRYSPVTDQMHQGDSKCRESLEQGLRRAWQLVDERQPLRLVLSQLTAIAESLAPDTVCSILLLDSEGLLKVYATGCLSINGDRCAGRVPPCWPAGR